MLRRSSLVPAIGHIFDLSLAYEAEDAAQRALAFWGPILNKRSFFWPYCNRTITN